VAWGGAQAEDHLPGKCSEFKLQYQKKKRGKKKKDKIEIRTYFKNSLSQSWQWVCIIPAPGRLRQKDQELKASLGDPQNKQKK
jgi:hypothetical protein